MKFKNLTINFHTFFSMTTDEYRRELTHWHDAVNRRADQLFEDKGYSEINNSNYEIFRDCYFQARKEMRNEKPVIDKSNRYWVLYEKRDDRDELVPYDDRCYTYDDLVILGRDMSELREERGLSHKRLILHAYPRKNYFEKH